MDALATLFDDEEFERKLAANAKIGSKLKRKKWNQLATTKKGTGRVHAAYGERFDVLEPPTDIPVSPSGSALMPSEQAYGRTWELER